MDRRRFLHVSSAGLAALATPRLALGAEQKVLRFVPHADLTVIDPTWNSAYVTRNHGYMVFDTLFGQDGSYQPQPQMLDGFAIEDDGKRWTLKLREGLKFHDGSKVLAHDCVASLNRWGKRDDFGKSLFAATDELSASDDRTIVFRLKRPYPLLPMALAKTGLMMAAIMPERIANGDPEKPITELVGSGPYRFKGDERLAGNRVVYERFEGYAPRSSGATEGTAGPKLANFDRVEWKVITDASTAGAALRTGEVDWWELPGTDMLPLMRKTRGIKVDVLDPSGYVASLRVNHAFPPTANAAIRRAMTRAISQRDVVIAMAGTDASLWRENVGFFCPGTSLANDAGLEAVSGPRDPEAVKRALGEAGYGGEKIALMVPEDLQINELPSEVVADNLTKAGFNVDHVSMDWGTLVQRRTKKDPPSQGGWGGYVVLNSGTDQLTPAVHAALRGNGVALNGWCESEGIEKERDAWLAAPDAAGRLAAAKRLQAQAFIDVPYIPLGQIAQLTTFREDLVGMIKGMPVFWNIKRG